MTAPDTATASRSLSFPRKNNLQCLRLVFALQVVVMHASTHLGSKAPGFLEHFPGVPAFFFVSGFLIYASYKNAPGIRYFENRFLRLIPALVFVALGGLGVVLYARGVADLMEHPGVYATWFLAQVTLGQAYNPSLFRDVGVGVINGSLWTLTTEILFYLMVPLIVWVEARFRSAVWSLVVLSYALYATGPMWGNAVLYRDKTLFDIASLTPLIWGWMFGLGMLAVRHFSDVARWMKYFPWAIVPLAAMMLAGASGPLFGASGNQLGAVYFAMYAALIVYAAFGLPVLDFETDLSYGIYIWHMPLVNLILVAGIWRSMWLAVALTLLMALVSWFLVERPALRMKKKTLKAA